MRTVFGNEFQTVGAEHQKAYFCIQFIESEYFKALRVLAVFVFNL